MRHAVINTESNLVVNVILWDGKSTWQPPDGHYTAPTADDSLVEVGWTYTDGQFNPPPEPQD